ncbi:MAG: alpha/beta fold hydrolase [Armatimonadota bacterium]
MIAPGLVSWTLHRDDVALRAFALGAGPGVLLLHGFSSSFRRNWHGTGWTKALAASGRRALGFDFRGHGGSARSESPAFYRPEILCADCASLQDAVGETRTDVVGFSMGAAIALQFAILHPERVRSLILGGIGDKVLPASPPPPEPGWIAAAMRPAEEPGDAPPIARRFRMFAQRGGNDLQALAAMMDGGGWPGRIDIPGPVRCNVLLVLAENDEFMPRTDALRATLPGARTLVVPGTDHIGLSGDPRFLEAGLGFLNEVHPPGP